ncbi:MarR family transcriptional regulator [Tateyamaria omphalii]|nr:MarR family transcriptional regulator [Tateyamaria omphalii]
MNRIMGRYNASLRDEMSAMGLTTVKMRAIAVLAVIDGPLIRDLAVYAVAEQSTLSRALDTLEQSGLVRREADSQDNRGTRIFLTSDGRDAFERIWPRMAASYSAMFKGISEEDQRVFVATLQTMLRNIRKHDF